MCIVAFAWQVHPQYPLILLLNRDEYYDRPTMPVGWWEGGEIIGGRDEVGGGTWLGCSRSGKLAFLTNVLELSPDPDARSRGKLPVRFLQSKKSPREYGEEVMKEADEYNGFNLIVADLTSKSMVYVSNRPQDGAPICPHFVSPGLHVLSNAHLNNSSWPKAERLGVKFKKVMERSGEGEIPIKEMVNSMMRDTLKADESKLPHICSLDWEFHLSSIFVKVDTPLGYYGTRSTAALTVSTSGEVIFYETYLEEETWKEHTLTYLIDKRKHI